MSRSQSERRWGFALRRYVAAVGIVAVAAMVRLTLLTLLGDTVPFVTFYPAVVLAALYGGFGPGMLATVVSTLLADYFWMEPIDRLWINSPAGWLGLVVFFVSCTMISAITEAMHRAEARARLAEAQAKVAVERERAIQSLREREAQLIAIAAATFEGIVESAEGRILNCNEQFAQMLGRATVELKGTTLAELIPTDERERVVAHLQRGDESLAEYTLLRKDGTRIFVEAQGRSSPASPTRRITAVHSITARKQVEAALQATGQQFYAILSSLHGSILLVNNEGRVEFANQSFCDFFHQRGASQDLIGLSAQELIGKIINGYAQPELAANRIRQIVQQGQPVTGEEVIMQDGRTCLRDFIPMSLAGKPSGRLWHHLDISARKRAEAALRESDERYRHLFKTLIEGFCTIEMVFDTDGIPVDFRFLETNPAFEQQTGLKNVRGRLMRELVPNHEAHWFEIYGRIALTGEPAHFENEARALGRYFEVSAYRIGGPESWKVAILCNDISARKRAEEQMRVQVTALQAAANAIVITDPTGAILWVNQAFTRLTGYSVAEAVGQNPRVLKSGVHPAKFYQDMWQTVMAGRVWQGEIINQRKDGVQYTEEMTIAPVYGNSRAITHFVAVKQDVTQRRQAEHHLQTSLREKEVLLKEVHHRVKNNLQVISSLISLQADALNQPAVREAFASVRDQVRAMALVHEKLYRSDDLARVEFAAYARSLLQDLWRAHGTVAANVKLTLDLEPMMFPVETAVPCGLILNELATNALKHAFRGRAGGEVKILLHGETEGRVRLQVQDNGVGLPAGLDWRQSRSLGLRLVQILAGQLEGAVAARSEGGTEFEIVFEHLLPHKELETA